MLKVFADGQLFGAAFGTEPASVLALHGWQRTHRDFDAVLDGFEAIALDLPGFGATPPPPEPWGSSQYASALVPVLGGMAAPVVVVGHSFGGRIAVHLAASHPDRVKALVLTGVPLIRRPSTVKPAARYRLGRALHRRGLIGDDRMEALRRRYGSRDYANASGVMRGVHVTVVNESYEEQLRAVHCPVELVWGEHDRDAPIDVARQAAALLSDANLVVVAGADHFTPQTATAALRAAIERRLT